MKSNTLRVEAGAGYDIHIGRGLLDQAGELVKTVAKGGKTAVVTDETVAALYGARLKASLEGAGYEVPFFAFPAGEANKTHKSLLAIYSFLAQSGITRSDTILALGGGVPGDVAGFAAATWQRGIRLIQVPTTLLAQVDSSIGGKTAVDLPEGKNLVGAFWQPSLVLCDPDTLDTLSPEIFACGMAEVVKHACIRSRSLFELLKDLNDPHDGLEKIIRLNLLIKSEIVGRDERESGERMLLNFGHTLGHAVEKLRHYTGITHGEAVAMGMMLVTRRSEAVGMTEPGTTDELRALLAKFSLPVECPLPLPDLLEAAKGDKKRAGKDLTLVLVKRIGEGFLHRIPVSGLQSFFGLPGGGNLA